MPEINKHEIRSEEMQEVMSGIPGSFLKWGLFLFFAILFILVAGSWFVKKPEVVTVPVVITTQDPPVSLVAQSGGRIDKLFAEEGTSIEKDSIVAIIGNTSDFSSVKKLCGFISEFNGSTNWITEVKTKSIPQIIILGEIQGDYTRFEKAWKQLKDYLEQAYIPIKLNFLEEQIRRKTDYNKELQRQKELLTEDIKLAKAGFTRDSLFYVNNSFSISPLEYDQSRQAYIQKLYSFSVFNASIKNNESDFLRMKETKLDLQLQYEKEVRQLLLSLDETLQALNSSVSIWKEKYLIKSPVAGKVTLTRFRTENQVIKPGEIVATVIPDNPADVVARAVIPASGFGKVEKGQVVNIKLSGFPYMQYGVLKGRISSFSQVPGEEGFIADIVLTEGMTSTYSEKIKFIHQMNGTAEIITEESRLIFKLISPLKSIISNN
jgi:multidrug efflux pump subunit AcrA (membrane-fusion protein)